MTYTVERPYGADDNEINTEQVKILEHWANRHGERITAASIYEMGVKAETATGRTVLMTMTDGCRSKYKNVRQYMQMWEDVNGKRIRIKKAEW